MLAEHLDREIEIERFFKAHSTGDLRHRPPVGSCLAGQWEKRALARDAAFGIRDGAILLAPRGGGEKDVSTGVQRVVRGDVLRNNEELEPLAGLTHRAGAR